VIIFILRLAIAVIFGWYFIIYLLQGKFGRAILNLFLFLLFQPLFPAHLGRLIWDIIKIAALIWILYELIFHKYETD
jgi:hypothetical protein